MFVEVLKQKPPPRSIERNGSYWIVGVIGEGPYFLGLSIGKKIL
jgi:hypothetical protein